MASDCTAGDSHAVKTATVNNLDRASGLTHAAFNTPLRQAQWLPWMSGWEGAPVNGAYR